MKQLIYTFLLYVLFVAITAVTHASPHWTPQISCNDRALVVDRRVTRDLSGQEVVEYQVVIRDPAAVAYLAQHGQLGALVNEKRELILPQLYSPSRGFFSGGVNPYYRFYLDHGGGTVAVHKAVYYGRSTTELAHWYFDRCHEIR